MASTEQTDKIAFDYAWNWFSLHAGQRMQSVNFFLVAASFLVGAYVSAMGGNHPGLAGGISVIGAVSSFVFYRIERRVRELLHVAEGALGPIEARLALDTGNSALRIVERAETTAPDAWKYSKVFRILYVTVGLGFLSAGIYATAIQVALTPILTTLFPLVLRLACGILLLLFAFETLSAARDLPSKGSVWFAWTMRMIGVVAAIAGIVVLFRLGFMQI